MKFSEYPPIVELQDNQSFLVSGPDGVKRILTKDMIDSLLKMTDYPLYNPNLLDNVDLPNAINQREITGTFSNEGQYFADRWVLVDGVVTVENDGWLLDGVIEQRREFSIGQETTATALTTTGVIEAEYNDTEKIYQLTASNKKILRPKLEIGKFSTVGKKEAQTWVCADPPPNYGQELRRCKRFLWSSQKNGIRKRMDLYNVNYIFFTLPVDVALRICPSDFSGNTSTIQVQNLMGGTVVSGFNFLIQSDSVENINYILVTANKQSHGISDAAIFIPSGIYLDAGL